MPNNDENPSMGFMAEFLKQNLTSVSADNSNILQRASDRASAEGIELKIAFKQEMEIKPNNNFGTNQTLLGFWSQK